MNGTTVLSVVQADRIRVHIVAVVFGPILQHSPYRESGHGFAEALLADL
jgi:hypothetical protein